MPLSEDTLDGIVRSDWCCSNDIFLPLQQERHAQLVYTKSILHKVGVERADIAKVTCHTSQAMERYMANDTNDFSNFTSAAIKFSKGAAHLWQ